VILQFSGVKSSKKGGLIVIFVLATSIFGYSQYASASQIQVNVAQSQLLGQTDLGSNYDVELQFQNPSLLMLVAGKTEFFVLSDDKIVGKGGLEPFTLQPLSSSYVSGTFYTDSGVKDESESVKITGVTKYDIILTSIDVPFVYYPTEEQTREFIHQD